LKILNGVHNHAMEPALEGHILAGRLKEDDKKLVLEQRVFHMYTT